MGEGVKKESQCFELFGLEGTDRFVNPTTNSLGLMPVQPLADSTHWTEIEP